MQRTLLETITTFCERRAVPVPPAVYGSTDTQVRQLRSLLEEGCNALAQRGLWQALTQECLITTIANEDQGAISTLAPGFSWMLWQTLWDRTNKRMLVGRLTPGEWQYIKAIVVTGPLYSFRIRAGKFIVNPAPPASETWAFEYVSEFWIAPTGSTVPTYKYFTADTNVILLPDNIVQADLTWRYKKEKGISFAQDFDDCEDLVIKALGRDGGTKPPIDMSSECPRVQPGVFVPQYNTVP